VAAARARERAAELSADDAKRGRLLTEAARCAGIAGADGEAVRLATAAEPLVQSVSLRGEIARSLALAQVRRGRPLDAVSLLMVAARELATADPAKTLDLLLDATAGATDGGDFGAQIEICALAARIEPPEGDDAAAFVSDFLNGLGAIAAKDLERGVPHLERAVERGMASDDPRHGLWGAAAAIWLGDHRQATALLRRASSLGRAQGTIGILIYVLGTSALQEFLQQRFDEAALLATEAAQFARELGAENPLSLVRGLLACVSAIRGEDEDARRQAEAALEHATAHGHRPAALYAVWALATIDLGRGRWAEAFTQLSSLTSLPRSFADSLTIQTVPDQIEAAARAGNGAQARKAFEAFAAWVAQSEAPWARPRLHCCRALVSQGDAATAEYEHALELAEHALPFDLARIHLLYGEHLRRERRRADARVHLRSAIDSLERMHAAPWAERAAAELRATGETARKRDPSTLDQLTPKEIQIARLVAEGRSNKEVAAQLFLSPRTIDYHLRNVFAKLGVTSRTQLAHLPLHGEAPALAAGGVGAPA
jgi:DNA-binding CsgD family transcriptional regulator